MNHLLILSVLAVLPLMEGQQITRLTACTTMTNDLSLNCHYKNMGSGTVNYEWSVLKERNPKQDVIASTINPSSVDSTYKNRVKLVNADAHLTLNLTGFGTSDDGKYTCRLQSSSHLNQGSNKTISVMKASIQKCGASGLLNTPWMLSLLLLIPILQALDALPCGIEN